MSTLRMINEVREYNQFIGIDTVHPLVNVIDFSSLPPIPFVNTMKFFGLYAIYLRDSKFSELRYGQSIYDYQEGTLVFVAPGQILGSMADGKYHQVKGYLLLFHPDILQNSSLQNLIHKYSYFSYTANEALQLSTDERAIVIDCFKNIKNELHQSDEYCNSLIVDYIKLLLDHCSRFYERQFNTRMADNKDVLMRLEAFLNQYFNSEIPLHEGLPTVQSCADALCLSANYFSDLVKRETGFSALKHIHRKTAETAKERLCKTSQSIAEIASELGFVYPQHFCRWFKKMTGYTPTAFREATLSGNSESTIK